MPDDDHVVEWLEEQDVVRLGDEAVQYPITAGETKVSIRLGRLFPLRSWNATGGNDWDIDGDEHWPAPDGDLLGRVGHALTQGQPTAQEAVLTATTLSWSTCSWYQPLHFFGHNWGIFVRRNSIMDAAACIARFLPPGVASSASLAKALVRAAFVSMYLHEQFQHKVESLAIRLHVIERIPKYLRYRENVYRPLFGTSENLEQALAGANAFSECRMLYRRWLGDTVVRALQDYLKWRFPLDPPGDAQAGLYLNRSRSEQAMRKLYSQVQEAIATPFRPPREWQVAGRLHAHVCTFQDHAWEVFPRDGTSRLLPGQEPGLFE